MRRALDGAVRKRANHCCEYCLMPQEIYDARFPIDHVISRQHGGATVSDNLALCCHPCNRFKGPNVAGLDTATAELTRLFHPRRDSHAEHFRWQGAHLVGLTAVGRVTVDLLRINHPNHVAVRSALIMEGRFPATRVE